MSQYRESANPGVQSGKLYEVPNERILQLVFAAKEGSEHAMEMLLEKFRPLVLTVARRYGPKVYEDAIQEGYLALIRSVYSYDVSRKIPFVGYLNLKLRGDVRTALRRMWRYDERVVSSSQHDGFSGTEMDLLDVWVSEQTQGCFCSLPPANSGGNSGGFGREEMALAEWWLVIGQADLSEREQLGILTLMQGWTSTEVAARQGVSPETVKTWRKRAIGKIRRVLGVTTRKTRP